MTFISCKDLLSHTPQSNSVNLFCPCCKNKSLRVWRVFLKNPRFNTDACVAMIAFSNLFKPNDYEPACLVSLLKPKRKKLHEDISQKMQMSMFCSLCKKRSELYIQDAQFCDSLMLSWDDPQKRITSGCPSKPAVKTFKNKVIINKRRAIPLGLRYEILVRDNSTCQCCGARAIDGIQLHVDHIKPVSRGGANVKENLQTLCADCNLGKSDKY